MNDNRRDFIKKSASVAASLSIGTMGALATDSHRRKEKATNPLNDFKETTNFTKDAGMKLCLANFAGK
jgi:mannonate dehydratase